MLPLNEAYQKEANDILNELKASEEFQKYLDTEEEEDYLALREVYEPRMIQLHNKVSDENPLQIVAMEKMFLNEDYEGLILPKILGFSVLRGEIDDNFKYRKPQDHFKDILLAIASSANFEWLKKRIGQSIQTGFSLSSDIWITNLLALINNKKVSYFLQSQKIPAYRILDERRRARGRFARQFRTEYFYTANFPKEKKDLSTGYFQLKTFLETRFRFEKEFESFKPQLLEFITNKAFYGTSEHTNILGLSAGFMDWNDADSKVISGIYNDLRNEFPDFANMHLDFILETHADVIDMDHRAENRISAHIDKSIKDDLTAYYSLMDEVHGKGYVHQDAVEAVRHFYNNHEGLSKINTCVRKTLLNFFNRTITNLNEEEYPIYMELVGEIPSKVDNEENVTDEPETGAFAFPIYMDIFSNQQFNQYLKDLSLAYIKKILKKHVDKRGKDYQDIKKFVSSSFVELGFLNKKQVVELFKTKRKKKPSTSKA